MSWFKKLKPGGGPNNAAPPQETFPLVARQAWCSVCELSERSVRGGSCPVEVPDFTRGGWRTAEPLGIVSVDLSKMNFGAKNMDAATAQEKI